VAFEIAGLPKAGEPTSRFTVPVDFIKTAAESAVGRSATTVVHGYAPIATEGLYFPLAGYYSTPIGVVWVPAPGYYHVVAPTQYHPPRAYRPPADWRVAHPAPSPGPPGVQSMPLNPSGIHTEYYWHPRAMDDLTSHEAWIRG
jgi:hypothetical protein